jgi:hypothetical protein
MSCLDVVSDNTSLPAPEPTILVFSGYQRLSEWKSRQLTAATVHSGCDDILSPKHLIVCWSQWKHLISSKLDALTRDESLNFQGFSST